MSLPRWVHTIVLSLLWASSAAVSFAQPAARGLTLAAAIDTALASNPLVRAAQHQVEASTASMTRARAAFLPRVDVAEALTYSDNAVFAFSARLNQGRFRQDDFDVGRLNDPAATRDFKTSLSLTQPLYTGGKATAGLAQAQAQHDASKHERDRQQQAVIFQVIHGYYGVLRAQADLVVVRAALQAAAAHRTLARTRVQSGLAVASDALSADVRLAGLQEQEIVARNQIAIAQATVNDAMGRPLSESWTPADQMTRRPGRHAQLEGLDALALEQRADYQQLEMTVHTLEYGVTLARAESLPTLRLSAHYDVHTRNAVSDGQGSWLVTLGVQWNLFNGLADRARVTEAQAQVARLKALRARLASQIQLEVREAFLGLQAAQQRISVAESARAQAQESLRIIRDRYETGLTTIVELLSNEAALTRAHGQYTLALYDYNVGLATLEFALGTISQDTF